jgi:probable phosphoglycerate mutase
MWQVASKNNRILLWRHGQTDWNIINRFQGHSDIALNKVGIYQAELAAPIIAGMEPTAILSSDLSRARDTASKLGEIVNMEVLIDERLRETNGGHWEGKTGAENRAADLENFVRWIDGNDNPAGTIGEKRSEVAARASAAIDEFLGDKENQLVVVATHGGTARCLIGHYLHLPMAHWGKIGGLSNARWSILQTSPKGWHLAEHNAGSILEPVFGEESGADVPDHVR